MGAESHRFLVERHGKYDPRIRTFEDLFRHFKSDVKYYNSSISFWLTPRMRREAINMDEDSTQTMSNSRTIRRIITCIA